MGRFKNLFKRKNPEQFETVQKEVQNPPFFGFGHAHAERIPLKYRTDFVKAYLTIPQLNFMINSISQNFSRGIFRLHKIQTNGKKVETFEHPFLDFLKNPNPVQAGVEWKQQFCAYLQIDGNGYNFAAVPKNVLSTSGININNIQSFWVLPSQFIDIILTGNSIYTATEKNEIIKYYRLNYQGMLDFLPDTIMHQNKITLDYGNTLNVIGDSPIKPLENPLSNINQAYLARGINLTEGKGVIAVTPKQAKGDLNVPLSVPEIKANNERFEKYGLQPGQHRIWEFTTAMDFNKIGWSLQELQIPEGIEDDTATIANQLQFPFILAQKKNSKFNDRKLALQELFNNNIIPISDSFVQLLQNHINLTDERLELTHDYSHLPELQTDRKVFAEVSAINTKSILKVQESVKNGTTTFEAGLQMIQDITGKTAEESAVYLPTKAETQSQVQAQTVALNGNGNGESKSEEVTISMN